MVGDPASVTGTWIRFFLAAFAFAAPLLLNACGGDDPASGAETPAEIPPPTGAGTLDAGSAEDRLRWRRDTGVDFEHRRYMTEGVKYLPETAGAGLAVLDYDGDGDLDLYFVQGCPLPGYRGGDAPRQNRLYRNDGDWKFVDVTDQARVGDGGYGMGVTCPDFDGDGYPDLMVTNVRDNVVYRNRGDGTFEDVTAACGLADAEWSTAAGWFDYDRDGDLDVYLANYAVCDFENYVVCKDKGVISYCHPDMLQASPDRLFRNDGDARFTDVTAEAGIVDLVGKGLAVVPFDHDGDGWTDLFVANDSNENFLWSNLRDGRFEEIAGLVGVAAGAKGFSQACMGTDIADVDGDLDLDIFSANFGKECNVLYLHVGDGFYEDHIARCGLGEASYFMTGFGSEFFDYDLDADLDLMVVNGHIIDVVEQLDPSQTFEQLPQFFENHGDGTFTEIGAKVGAYFREKNLGRGLVTADLDGDGDLDVVVNNNGHAAALLENRVDRRHHWIGLQLTGSRSPRDPIGAQVLLTSGDKTQLEELHGSTSYLSWNDLRIHFGLGDRGGECRAEIRWPSGVRQVVEGLAADRYHAITEPAE